MIRKPLTDFVACRRLRRRGVFRRMGMAALMSGFVLTSTGCATLDTHPNLVSPEAVALGAAGTGFFCGMLFPVIILINTNPATTGAYALVIATTGALGSGLGAWHGAPIQPREAHVVNASYGSCVGTVLGLGFVGGYYGAKSGSQQPAIPKHLQKQINERRNRGGAAYPHLRNIR
ncbi:MAG: hypothetical protein K0U36_03745 [Alphaproteobacteria bacterium]|nr:hypothetical protein [Alphaproteobacteria bacterium]